MRRLTGIAILALIAAVSFVPNTVSVTQPAVAAPIPTDQGITVIPWQPEGGSAYLSDGTSVLTGTERLERSTHSNVTYAGVASSQNYRASPDEYLVIKVNDGTNGVVQMIPLVTVTIANDDPLYHEKLSLATQIGERAGLTVRVEKNLDSGILR